MMSRFTPHATRIALLILLLSACAPDPSRLPADQRPIPRELPVVQRDLHRLLPLSGTQNARDIGGYQTTDGLHVKWGMMYRSDDLSGLTEGDQEYLTRLNIQRVVDFRSQDEVSMSPDLLPAQIRNKVQLMPINITGVNIKEFSKSIKEGRITDLDLPNLLMRANRDLVENFSPTFRQWIHSLVEDNTTPMLFHCTAGKDRTGFASAIFLLALGVPKDTVVADYVQSTGNLWQKAQQTMWMIRLMSFYRNDVEQVMPLLQVRRAYLEEAFHTMEEKYGSVDNYMRDALGVDEPFKARLRARFLE